MHCPPRRNVAADLTIIKQNHLNSIFFLSSLNKKDCIKYAIYIFVKEASANTDFEQSIINLF